MAYVALGLLVLGVVLGRLWARHGPRLAAKGPWRPAASIAALAVLVAALFCAVREAFGPAAVLIALAVYLMLQARRRAAPQPPPQPQARGAPSSSPRAGMSRTQAASLLGVAREATPETVQEAYVRLMRLAHPDRGGTSGLAAQLNAARDVMLNRDPGGWL